MTSPRLHIDFETRSAADLRLLGAWAYARHPSTDLWCVAFAFDDGPIEVWQPGEPVPDAVAEHVLLGLPVVAHNAGFEWSIWTEVLGPRHGWPVPVVDQLYCTAAMAAAMALPRSLEDVAAVLGLPVQKDLEGHRLMLRMARPRRTNPDGSLVWWNEPDRVERLIEYCRNDVEVERQVEKRVRPLPPFERELFKLDLVVNRRGVAIDVELVEKCQALVEDSKRRIDAEMIDLTGGVVTAATQRDALLGWLQKHGAGDIEKIDKAAIAELLGRDDIGGDARSVIELRADAAKASTAKLRKMLQRVCNDGRVRDNLMYHGAGRTGRYAGRGIQPQNFPRPVTEDFAELEEIIDTILHGADAGTVELLYGPVMAVVADLLRPCVVAGPGRELISVDFTSIEARMLAWEAGEKWKVDAFRREEDIYAVTASKIFGHPVTKKDQPKERQVGKTAELSAGYGGSVGAWRRFDASDTYSDDQVREIIGQWREQHPGVVQLWRDLEAGALQAVREPGSRGHAMQGRVMFFVRRGFLWMKLPSGRLIAFANPRIEETETPWGELRDQVTFMGIDSFTHKWTREKIYGGKWAAVLTQGLARDVMCEAMLRVETAGYPVVLTVHDEIVSEVPAGFGSLDEFIALMVRVPAWARGCPISADGWRHRRYHK